MVLALRNLKVLIFSISLKTFYRLNILHVFMLNIFYLFIVDQAWNSKVEDNLS